jgi:hypothetical protein
MFVYSLRASTIKIFGIATVAVALLVALIIFIPDYGTSAVNASVPVNEGGKAQVTEAPAEGVETQAPQETRKITYDKIKTAEDRINFLKQFGWEVTPDPVEEIIVSIPAEFDKIFAGYNELQKQQGLDLSKYKNKELTRYTYTITNYENYDGTVYANILVYRNRVIGGDICSADANGFVHGFDRAVNN